MHRNFKDDLHSSDFQLWLVATFNLKDREKLEHFFSLAENDDSTQALGRMPLSLEDRKRICNFWKTNSQISVHQGKRRHFLKITEENLNP